MHVILKLSAVVACVAVEDVTQKTISARQLHDSAPWDSSTFNGNKKKIASIFPKGCRGGELGPRGGGHHRLKSGYTTALKNKKGAV